jgi:hypothetical protein
MLCVTPISDLWRIEQENFTGQVPTFRQFLMANVISDIGAFMQSVGAAWFMLSPVRYTWRSFRPPRHFHSYLRSAGRIRQK